MKNFNFVTDGSVVYYLAGNGWYAVTQDDDKVMLIDTDCKIAGKRQRTYWSEDDWDNKRSGDGEYLLQSCNALSNTYFKNIQYAIEPRTVTAGIGTLENAYMWPMSKEEFDANKVVGNKIIENACDNVWTRTFSNTSICNNSCLTWRVYSSVGAIYDDSISHIFSVAPAFYLKKSAIDHINENGRIVLMDLPELVAKTDCKILLYNAILEWYNNSVNTYYGLDDPDFIDMACHRTGLSRNEYFSLMF